MSSLDPLGQVEVLLVIFILSCRTALFGIDAASCLTGLPWISTFEGVFAFAILLVVLLDGLDALKQKLDVLAVAQAVAAVELVEARWDFASKVARRSAWPEC